LCYQRPDIVHMTKTTSARSYNHYLGSWPTSLVADGLLYSQLLYSRLAAVLLEVLDPLECSSLDAHFKASVLEVSTCLSTSLYAI
jgi:hypothetical protein